MQRDFFFFTKARCKYERNCWYTRKGSKWKSLFFTRDRMVVVEQKITPSSTADQ